MYITQETLKEDMQINKLPKFIRLKASYKLVRQSKANAEP